jgi:hypothetical protein
VVNDVLTYSIVSVEEKCDLEFGAHTIDAGNKNGVGRETLCREEASEATDPSQDLRAMSGSYGRSDPFFCFVGR